MLVRSLSAAISLLVGGSAYSSPYKAVGCQVADSSNDKGDKEDYFSFTFNTENLDIYSVTTKRGQITGQDFVYNGNDHFIFSLDDGRYPKTGFYFKIDRKDGKGLVVVWKTSGTSSVDLRGDLDMLLFQPDPGKHEPIRPHRHEEPQPKTAPDRAEEEVMGPASQRQKERLGIILAGVYAVRCGSDKAF